MQYSVVLSLGAEDDLVTIHKYIAANDSEDMADAVFNRLLKKARTLKTLPERGNHCWELFHLGYRQYRELQEKPYKIETSALSCIGHSFTI